MIRTLLKSKIHRAIVTDSNLDYVGSLTLGHALCEAADIVPYEFVHITNINTGTHWVTYVIRDPDRPDSVGLNGTAARHFHPGDPVIVLAYTQLHDVELAGYAPRLVYVNQQNVVTRVIGGEHPRQRDETAPEDAD
jgi:aspartate 1-decarboxylase